jgi:periodic tryptophan protein 2
VFSLYDLDTLNSIHSFQISQNKIDSVSINAAGDWIGMASKEQGQLFVWEWQSETYVLKQQGHFFDLNTVAYSPDGNFLATGGDDGKVKLWTTKNCLCFATFSEHTGKVTALQFTPRKGNSVLSASLDGTVRAYDLVKYRNYRTMTTPKPAQFSCLAIEQSGDIVAAGSVEPYDIYLWSLRTGQLLEVLSSHQAPVSGLSFSPPTAQDDTGSRLASSSWDNTVKIWDIFGRQGLLETLQHSSEVV